jgi:hypothetical protein
MCTDDFDSLALDIGFHSSMDCVMGSVRTDAIVREFSRERCLMPDDPTKKGAADRKRVSQQPHEQKYQAQKAKKATAKRKSDK